MIRVFVHVRREAKVPVPVIVLRIRRDGPHGLGDRERLNGLVDQSLDGVHYCGTLVVDATHAGTMERICQSGIAEIGLVQIGTFHVGVAQVGTAQVGITEKRILEVGTGQDGTLEVGIIEAGLTQVGTGHVGVGQVRTGQVGLEYGGPA